MTTLQAARNDGMVMKCQDHRDKTKRLFEIRRISQNCYVAGLSEKESSWIMSGLTTFQQCIYELDVYGESVWEIEDSKLSMIWEKIYATLHFFGLNRNEMALLVRDIKKYQNIELGLRSGISPLGLDIRHFYHLKTCDVRLSRTLIQLIAQPKFTKPPMMELWNCYDIIGEVYDDMVDVAEDSRTYNCNRLLVENELFGANQVQASYRNLVSTVQTEAAQLIKNVPGDRQEFRQIYRLTESIANKVLSLLGFVSKPFSSSINIPSNLTEKSKGFPPELNSFERLRAYPCPFDQSKRLVVVSI
jgi:hypothetical protein